MDPQARLPSKRLVVTCAVATQVLGSLGWRLSAGEVAELTAQAKKLKKGMVQNIFQTP